MSHRLASILFFLFLCFSAMRAMADPAVNSAGTRPKVAVVLGGGGAHGVAHLGVLRELERQRIPIDLVVATGFGGIIGGLYASGMTTDEINEFLLETDWSNVFDPDTQREDLSFRRKQDDDDFLIKYKVGVRDGQAQLPTSLVPNKKFAQILQSVTANAKGIKDFDALPIPFRTVAMDLVSGDEVVLQSGALDRAMLATTSSPGTLPPVRIDDRLLITGSLINNLPVDVAKEWGADVIIVVDIGTYIRSEDDLSSIFAIVDQVGHLVQVQNSLQSLQQLSSADILVTPDIDPVQEVRFGDPVTSIERGAAAVTGIAASFDHVRLDKERYASFNADRMARRTVKPVISGIELRNESIVDDNVILAQISQPLGATLDKDALDQDIRKVFGIGSFSSVEFSLREDGESSVLELHTVENRAGNRFWRFGISLQDDLEGNSAYTGSASMTWTNLNSLGGEWRNVLRVGELQQLSTEFYQPLVSSGRYFVSASAGYKERNVNRFVDAKIVGQSRVKDLTGLLSVGRIFGNSGQVSAGFLRGTGSTGANIGSNIPSADFDVGGYTATTAYDTFDNVYFPKQGVSGLLNWVGQRESVGASVEVDIVTGRLATAKTWDANTLIAGVILQSQLEDVAGAQNLVTTGGLFNLSGFQRDELSGRHTAVGRVIAYRQLRSNPLRGFLNASLYVGGSLEIGNAWQDSDDVSFSNMRTAGSLFIGADTFIGPVYLAGGLAEGGNSAFYLYVGRPF
ncbi:MAG: patatin-like phospholipase family protein [Gammaproteobacteria bacterium]